MTEQLQLFDTSILGDLSQHPLAAAFVKFHNENPEIFLRLRSLALKTRRAGRDRYSIRTLYHVLRWEHSLETTDKSYKLNNNHTPFYARLLMKTEKELDGFFETRQAIADDLKLKLNNLIMNFKGILCL